MREAMKQGQVIPRKHKVQSSTESGYTPLPLVERKTFEYKLNRVVCQNSFLIYVNLNIYDLIFYVYGNRVDVNSGDFDLLRTKAIENCRLYKVKTLKQFKSLVIDLINRDPLL